MYGKKKKNKKMNIYSMVYISHQLLLGPGLMPVLFANIKESSMVGHPLK